MNKTQLQTIQYLLSHVEQATEHPTIALETLARKINVEVVCCYNGTYQIKKDGQVLYYGTFRDVLENLTLHILDN